MAVLLQLLGGLLLLLAAFAAIALPGADANATFTNEGWAYIGGVALAGAVLFYAGVLAQRR